MLLDKILFEINRSKYICINFMNFNIEVKVKDIKIEKHEDLIFIWNDDIRFYIDVEDIKEGDFKIYSTEFVNYKHRYSITFC